MPPNGRIAACALVLKCSHPLIPGQTADVSPVSLRHVPRPIGQAVRTFATSSNPNVVMACSRSTNFCTLPLAVSG